jgi:hypothetical protein
MISRKIIKWTVGAAAALAATAALAGDPVTGYGNTRAEAAANAEANARAEAARRNTCITPVRPQDCHQDNGGWICVAYVANHQGSC